VGYESDSLDAMTKIHRRTHSARAVNEGAPVPVRHWALTWALVNVYVYWNLRTYRGKVAFFKVEIVHGPQILMYLAARTMICKDVTAQREIL
jgi:hypothetical protein